MSFEARALIAVLLLTVASLPASAQDDCCYQNGSPGCSDPQCQLTVCDADPFCCTVTWDILCARAAEASCGGLCSGGPACPGSGDCCAAHAPPGCDDAACCTTICGIDPFCCEGTWDVLCAADAVEACGGCRAGDPCSGGSGSCCLENGSPGCDDATCCATICAADDFCCSVTWDIICATTATDLCAAVCPVICPSDTDCCNATGMPGCDDEACCGSVCGNDPYCCTLQWDAICATTAQALCAACGAEPGDCCEVTGTPGCGDPDCEATICAIDPFCCDTEWDQICVDEAIELCGSLCLDCPGPCPGDINGSGAVDVEDLSLLITLWGTNGGQGGDFTCDQTVDVGDLVILILAWGACDANPVCPGDGSCFESNGTPGCADEACCKLICAADPFCCDTEWDQICVDQAKVACNSP